MKYNMKNNILLFFAISSFATSCTCNGVEKTSSATSVGTSQLSVSELSDSISALENTFDDLSELMKSSGDSLMLSSQALTSYEDVMIAFDNGCDLENGDFLHESTPATSAFYLPGADIKGKSLTKAVQIRYNFAAAMNRVLHGYEWYDRMVLDADSTTTRKDTLAWIKESQPAITKAFVNSVIPHSEARDAAIHFMSAYKKFDGDDSEESALYEANIRMNEVYGTLPVVATKEMLNTFEEEFWTWYDKEQFIPGISQLILMNMDGYKGDRLSDEQINQLKKVVLCETDIDRRTILALELVKFDEIDGILLLGDILESGIYTRYLLEAWVSWRAHVQLAFSPSSFSVIPNNYYDKMRVKCLDTFVHHCLEDDDDNTKCLIENMILVPILHRMGSIAGNESLARCASLSYREFIHPSLQEE